jgi:hypothetical protein
MEAIRDHKKVTVRSANGVGKDWTAANIALWFLYTHEPAVVITTAPTNRQVEQVLWGEIRRKWAKANNVPSDWTKPLGGRCLNLKIEIEPKWYAIGFSTDDESQFQGFHDENILIIFSEAQGIKPIIYTAASGCLTSGNAKLLLIGNPLIPSGDFYNSFRDPSFHKIKISAFDSPNVKGGPGCHKVPGIVTHEWVEEKKLEWGEDHPFYQARVLGEFPMESDDTLISLRWIEAAIDRPIEVPTPRKALGVDVARYGSCETVLAEFDGYRARFPSIRKDRSIVDTFGDIVAFMAQGQVESFRAKEIPIFVDDIGVGGGLTDLLQREGYRVNPVAANAVAVDAEKYYSKRDEMYWELRERFRMGTISIPRDEKLISQLAGLKYEHTTRGQIRLISKEKLRKEGFQSPDRADALALAVYGWNHGSITRVHINFDHIMAGGGRGGY